MPQRCSLCIHEQRREIDTALVTGTSYRNIAERFGTSLAAIFRHKSHAAHAIVKASERREERLSESLLDEMRRMNRKAWELLSKAESEGDFRGAIVALREARECIEAQDKMLVRAAETGGNHGPVFQVQVVYGGQPLRDDAIEAAQTPEASEVESEARPIVEQPFRAG